jgi:hypothetical protein
MRRASILAPLGSIAACAALALTAAPAAASPLDEYQQTGHISPCKYSAGQLQGSVPNDVAQYAPEYLSQLQAAARDRARGCGAGTAPGASGGGASKAAVGGVAAVVGGGGGGSGRAPGPPHAVAAKRIGPALNLPRTVSPAATGVGTTPGPVLALAILAALALLAAVLALATRALGFGAGWTSPGRHALREAGMRIGAAITGVADWARARGASGT